MRESSSFSLYIHIPFCIAKCPYCDFNSYAVGKTAPDEPGYVQAVTQEIAYYAEEKGWKQKECLSIFFGGGTPSLLKPESISEILNSCKKHFLVSEKTEITLETNPGTVQEELGREKLSAFFNLGVNRISLGAQSFSKEKLSFLGRLHSPEDVRKACENIVSAGFSNFNIDLMHGTNVETIETWTFDLASAISLKPTHISAYGLTIEPGTEFGRRAKKGEVLQTNEDLQARLYVDTQDILLQAGYAQYEISNFSKPEKECLHNLSYWTGIDYLGIGAGAHSFKRAEKGSSHFGYRWSNIPGTQHYQERALKEGSTIQREDEVTLDEAKVEFFFLGLRTVLGFSKEQYETLFGESFGKFAETLNRLSKEGLIQENGAVVSLTKKGFLFADYVTKEFCQEV